MPVVSPHGLLVLMLSALFPEKGSGRFDVLVVEMSGEPDVDVCGEALSWAG